MTDEAINILFQKHDQLRAEVVQLDKSCATNAARLERLERDFTVMQEITSKQHGEVIGLLNGLRSDFSEIKSKQAFSEGAKDAKRWLIPVCVSLALVVIGLIGLVVGLR